MWRWFASKTFSIYLYFVPIKDKLLTRASSISS
jgi:hypothetical protein